MGRDIDIFFSEGSINVVKGHEHSRKDREYDTKKETKRESGEEH